ncbi:MAG: hypothetical protein IKV63_00565, partial [Clostridia bacterium]|nr:hypothetical protein [Clostridia bacterium]
MKKIMIILSVLLAFLYVTFLFSNDTEVYNISKLSNWSFQYNSSSNDYSLFFAILDDKDKPVKAEL